MLASWFAPCLWPANPVAVSSTKPLNPVLFYDRAAGDPKQGMIGRSRTATVALEPGSIVYSKGGTALRIQFDGARPVFPEGFEAAGQINILRGASPEDWRTDAALYRKAKYRNLYKNVDLVLGDSAGLKSEYLVGPGGDSSRIRLRFGEGAQVSLQRGELVVRLDHGEFRETPPVAWQEGTRGREQVDSSFRLYPDGTVGFRVGNYDHSRALVIDPDVSFSTFWGGSLEDGLTGVAVGQDGSIFVCGWTESSDTPVQNANQPWRGSIDAFVMKLSTTNAVVYASYLGGSAADRANAIAVDASGNAYVTGWTQSRDFPIKGAVQAGLRGSQNTFVTKLSATGGLVYSTYFGGSGSDAGNAIQVDSTGAAYVAGQTTSADLPVVSGAQPRFGGVEDAFAAKLSPNGSTLVYSTYVGGHGHDEAYALAVLNGEAYIAGATDSQDYPVVNAFQPTNHGGQDAFVTKLASSGATILFSTYLGGTGGSPGSPEMALGIAVSPAGEAIVAGTTGSTDFPVAAPVNPSISGFANDAFVARLSADGAQLLFGTYLGGTGFDAATSVALDSAGNIYVAGETSSQDLQVVNPIQSSNAGMYNAFLASLSGSGKSVCFETYWGGNGSDVASALAIDRSANPVIAGQTTSWNLPLKNPIQAVNGEYFGGFISRFSGMQNLYGPVLPTGIGTFNSGHWHVNLKPAQDFWFGMAGDKPVVGDWDGSGTAKIGVYRAGQWILDYNGNFAWDGLGADRVFWFGLPGDIPVVGDWDGSGAPNIGVYRNGLWVLDYNGNFAWDGLGVDRSFWFGMQGDIPLVGDWDGSGTSKIGVYRTVPGAASQWFLDYNGNQQWDGCAVDRCIYFGQAGDIPVIGDWDGTGWLRIGVYRNGYWILDLNGNYAWDGANVDAVFSFGSSGDVPITGVGPINRRQNSTSSSGSCAPN